jgi:hypothetical protein
MCDVHRRRFLARSLGLGTVGLMAAASASLAQQGTSQDQPSQKWMCPPCGCPSDGKTFDAPGACPSCSMPLIRKPEEKSAPAQDADPSPRRP